MGKRLYIALVVLTACVAATAQTAQAKPFGAGDRPSEIKGYEIWSNKVVSTEDYRGKWLLVDFFATWCGPCMGELPNLIKETADLRGDRFEVLGVSLDAPETVDKLRPTLKEKGAHYPMIYQGGTWKTPPATEWGVRSIPASYLVNPQGVVVATNLRGEALRPLLEFFLNHPGDYPAISINAKPDKVDVGSPIPVTFVIDNPRHTAVKMKVTIAQYVPVYAADDPDHKKQPIDMQEKKANPTAPDYTYDVDCSKNGAGTEAITIPVDPTATYLEVDYDTQLPDSVDGAHPDGVWLSGYWGASVNKKPAAPAAAK